MNDAKLYKQISHPIHLRNYKCHATCNWFAYLVVMAIELRREEKVKFD